MPKGRITESFEKHHMLFCRTLLSDETPTILFVSHCESDDPMHKWIQDKSNQAALEPYKFSGIVCGTALVGGRFASIIQPLRDELHESLWKSITDRMLDIPRPSLSRLWNSICNFFSWPWKFLSNQFSRISQIIGCR